MIIICIYIYIYTVRSSDPPAISTWFAGKSPIFDDSSELNLHLLVGGLEHGFYDFPYIGNVIIPTD